MTRGETLWEVVCDLSGRDGDQPIELAAAIERAAAGPEIARTEIKQLLEQGMLEETDDPGILQLTAAGRLSCAELHGTQARLEAPVDSERGDLI